MEEIKREHFDNYFLSDSLLSKLSIESDKDPTQLFEVHYLKGKLNMHHGFFEDAELAFKKAISIAIEMNDLKRISKGKMRLADNYMDRNKFDLSIETSLEAIDAAKDRGDSALLANAYGNLAENYRVGGLAKMSVSYNQKALDLLNALKDSSYIIRIYNNFSIVIGKLGENERAIDSLEKALSIIPEKDMFGKAKINSSIAYCYRNMGNFKLALSYNKKSLSIKQTIHDSHGIGYSLGAIGRSYLGLGKIDSGLYYIRLSLDTARKYRNLHRIKDAINYLSDAYREDGQYKKAIEYLDSTMLYDDSIYSESITSQVGLYQQKYDVTQKEKMIHDLEDRQQLEATQRSYMQLGLLSLGLLLVSVLSIFLLVMKKRKQERRIIELKLSQVNREVERNQEELNRFAEDLIQKNSLVKKLNEQLIQKESELSKVDQRKSDDILALTETKILTDDDWKKFKQLFERVHPGFFEQLLSSKISYTKGERRLIALMKLNLNIPEISDMLGISSESVSKSRFRLKRKLQLNEEDDLDQYIHGSF